MNYCRILLRNAVVFVVVIGTLPGGCSDDKGISGSDKSWNWKPLEHGILGSVYALQVFDDQLFAGGHFDVAGGEYADNIAIWDGSQWAPAGNGTNGMIRDFTIYNDQLIACGSEGQVIVYDGITWTMLGGGLPGMIVRETCVHHDSLFAVGKSESINDPELFVAVWDGTAWTMIESGTSGYGKAVCVYQDVLVAGGEYLIDQTLHPFVTNLSDGAWSYMDSETLPGGIYDLLIYDSDLFVAGRGDYPVKSFSSSWLNTGSDAFGSGYVYSLGQFNGSLIAGGSFSTIGTSNMNHIASWDGAIWSPLGDGIAGGSVLCMTVWNGDLYVGGSFTEAGAVAANSIARWSLE